jgi:hypothetical protein
MSTGFHSQNGLKLGTFMEKIRQLSDARRDAKRGISGQ